MALRSGGSLAEIITSHDHDRIIPGFINVLSARLSTWLRTDSKFWFAGLLLAHEGVRPVSRFPRAETHTDQRGRFIIVNRTWNSRERSLLDSLDFNLATPITRSSTPLPRDPWVHPRRCPRYDVQCPGRPESEYHPGPSRCGEARVRPRRTPG